MSQNGESSPGLILPKDQHYLVVIDANLGDAALEIIQRYLPNVTVVHDPVEHPERKQKTREAQELIRSRDWFMIISFYQELIFKEDDLLTTLRPLNIHPSRPEIPGMSYDVGPLIEGSETYGQQGATLHFMTEAIDDGAVIKVAEHPVPDGADYLAVRQGNQRLCLDLLLWLCEQIVAAEHEEHLDALLRQEVKSTARKWGTYISTPVRDQKLLELYDANPDHPALRGNKKFRKLLEKLGRSNESAQAGMAEMKS